MKLAYMSASASQLFVSSIPALELKPVLFTKILCGGSCFTFLLKKVNVRIICQLIFYRLKLEVFLFYGSCMTLRKLCITANSECLDQILQVHMLVCTP